MNGTDSREEMGFNANITPRDFWFSKKGNNIYVTSLKWPENKEVLIESLTRLTRDEISKIESIKLLGCDEKVSWSMEETGLKVTLPSIKPNAYGYVLRITFKNV
jgi:alpha-L-fucosidase